MDGGEVALRALSECVGGGGVALRALLVPAYCPGSRLAATA